MIIAELSAALAGVGMAQCFLGLALVRRFVRVARSKSAPAPAPQPPVTILKPLCGDEPLLEQALESCFLQAYAHFQIVFGVKNPGDPALVAVENLRRRYPRHDIAVVVDPTLHGPNHKLSNLINMLAVAKHAVLVISDSDLHLPPNYLQKLVTELAQPGTGMVTALYVGRPPAEGEWLPALGATQISHHFLPSVLISRALGRQDCLGSTVMLRRETLDRIGGFHPLVQVLAEDNFLGQRIQQLGLSVGLVDIVPTATVPEPSLAAVWQHEMRWTRTIRQLAPISLCGSVIQYPLFWCALTVVFASAAPWSIAVYAAGWASRVVCARGIDRALRGRVGLAAIPIPVWVFPVRDLLSVVEIGASFWINEVIWRGHRLAANGTVTLPLEASL